MGAEDFISMGGLAQFMDKWGGWAVAAICLIVIARMAAYIVKIHREQIETARKDSEAQKEEARKTAEALLETRVALGAFREAMEALARKL